MPGLKALMWRASRTPNCKDDPAPVPEGARHLVGGQVHLEVVPRLVRHAPVAGVKAAAQADHQPIRMPGQEIARAG